jgi:hypothetical protein
VATTHDPIIDNGLAQAPTLQAVHTLTRLCIVPRITYALRATPPALTREAARVFDDAVEAAMLHLIGTDVAHAQLTGDVPLMQRRLHLPLKLGGAGVFRTAAAAEAAYIGSLALAGPRMSRLVSVPHGALLQHGELPPGAPQGAVPPSTAPLVVGFDAALESLRSKDPAVAEELQCISARTLFGGEADAVLNLQHKLMQHVMLREQRDIHRELLGNGTLPERQRAAAFVACGNGGGAWAGVLPQLTNPRHPCSLPDQTFAVAMALRLGAPLFREPHLCGAGCGKEMDAYGHHLFRCTKLRAVNTRHAAVNAALIRVMSDAAKAGSGALPKKEALASAHFPQKPTDVDSEGRLRLRRADIILVNPTAPLAPPILVDVQVSHPDPAKIPGAQDLSKPAAVTDAIETRKIKWWTDRLDIDPKLIVPAAFTTYGAVGRRLQALLKQLANEQRDKSNTSYASSYSAIVRAAFERVSVGLQVGNAHCFAQYLGKTGRKFDFPPRVLAKAGAPAAAAVAAGGGGGGAGA